MTRFARVSKRKHLDATPWSELSRGAGSARASNSSKEQNSEKQKSSAMEKQKSLKRKHVDSGYELVSGKKFKKGSSKDKRDEKREKKQSKVKSKEEHLLTKGKPEGKKVCDDEKAEKIREARRQRRKKSKVCFNCREPGHRVSDCPQASKTAVTADTCYKCGSTGHTSKQCKATQATLSAGNSFPFAKCFICKETGHISRQCPDNPKGLYPNGGACKCCGSVEHFKKDCPENPKNQKSGSQAEADFSVLSSSKHKGHLSADSQADFDQVKRKEKPKKKGQKVVVF